MATIHHKYRVHRNLSAKSGVSVRHGRQSNSVKPAHSSDIEGHKVVHFVLTLLTFGLWGLVWWWLILKSEGKTEQLFRGFDDAYWSYLIEREQPPAALHKMKFDDESRKGYFDA
ncbi:hypothetical protein [uncultured Shewanella sp.]|uniref:hypothetical protein n=1 Tax=Shewanella atlantica TaxID=271099 RepID=UPI00260698B8|nr:hypothetical protein [uncultured Shewanella sp.]